MKKLITLSIACAALVFSSATASAQGSLQKNNDGNNKGKVGQQLKQKREGMQKTLQSLNLTDEQKSKIKEIMKKSREDIQAVMKGEGDKKAKAEKVMAIRKETQAAIRNVLTEEQKKKYDEAVNKAKDKAPLNEGKAGQQLKQKALESLNLSDEQKSKIKEIMKKSREDIQAVMKGEGDKKAKAAKVKAIRNETQEAIRNVLTEEQKKKLDEAQKKAPLKKGKEV